MFDVNDLKEEAVRKRLQELIDWLNELDGDDYFGSDGWKCRVGWEN